MLYVSKVSTFIFSIINVCLSGEFSVTNPKDNDRWIAKVINISVTEWSRCDKIVSNLNNLQLFIL